MANPQPDRYTRLSNELYEAIMQTDFSKRQRSILDLIIRASYGCNKTYALLRPSDFEVVGVYKTHVKKELEYLCRARVISWDGERITLNKDYDQWRINLCKPCNENKLQEILRRNISGEVTETVTKVTKTVTIEQTDGYQNSNQEVTKIVTETPQESQQPSVSEGCLKTIKDNSSSSSSSKADLQDVIQFFQKNVCPALSPLHFEKLHTWFDDGMERDLLLYVMEKAVMAGAYRFDYIDSTLRDMYTKGIRTKDQALVEEERFKSRQRGGKQREQSQSSRGSPTRGRGEHKNYSGAGTEFEGLIISGRGHEAAEPG